VEHKQISDSRKWAAFNLALVGAHLGIAAEGKSNVEIEYEYGLITEPQTESVELVEYWIEFLKTADFSVVKDAVSEEWQIWLFLIPSTLAADKKKFAELMIYVDEDVEYLEKFFDIFQNLREMRKLNIACFDGFDESEAVLDYVLGVKNSSYDDEVIQELFAYFDPYSVRGVFWRAAVSFLLSPENATGVIIRAANLGDSAIVTTALAGLIVGAFSGRLEIPGNWKRFLNTIDAASLYEEFLDNWAS